MSTTIQGKMHAQHRRWHNEHETWRADIDAWRKELREALTSVRDVEELLRGALHALETHADAVWENEQRLRAHERTLSDEVVAGARKKTDKQWAAAHHRQAAQHQRTSDAHARIGKYQRKVVAAVMRLLKRALAAE